MKQRPIVAPPAGHCHYCGKPGARQRSASGRYCSVDHQARYAARLLEEIAFVRELQRREQTALHRE